MITWLELFLRRLLGRETLLQKFKRTFKCPDCGGTLYEGPQGGLAVNVRCGSCGAQFNLVVAFDEILSFERLSEESP